MMGNDLIQVAKDLDNESLKSVEVYYGRVCPTQGVYVDL